MAIDLPALPRGSDLAPRLVTHGMDLRSTLGGPTLRVTRLGSRMAIDATLPVMDRDCGGLWIAARMKAHAEGAMLRLAMPQLNAVTVAAATASSGTGTGLVKSGGAGVTVGCWFSFVVGGRAYLHQVTGVAGNNLTVAPALRASPAGQALNFAAPTIEGLVDGVAWTLARLRFIGQTFAIEEAR